ncbi:uncharacterized protein [Ptychodera flava]|uniref:uncharacterized protein isoform X2 n=1 Tax=Ptychodera flava TaxID=63121 RepID=UPI00396A796E
MELRHCPIETNMMAYDDLRTSVLYVHGIPCGVFPVALKPCDTMSRIRELIHYERQLHVHHGSFYLARGRKLIDGLTVEEQLIDDESNVWYHIGLRGGADNDPNNTKGSDEQFGKAVLHSGAIQCEIRDCEIVQIGNHNTIVQSSNDACADQHPESPTTLPQTDSSHRERKPLGPSEGEVLMLLHSIANPNNIPSVKPCTLNELATRFDTEYCSKVKMKFKDFGYGSMKNFLKKHPDWFTLVERGQVIFVHALYQRRNMKMQPSPPQAPLSLVQNSSENCSKEGQISDESQFRDQGYEDDGSSICSSERDISPESDDYSTEWKVVQRQKNKRLDSEHKMRRKNSPDESQSSYRDGMVSPTGDSYGQSMKHHGRKGVCDGAKVSSGGLGNVQPVKLKYADPSANAIPQQSYLDISVRQKGHISVNHAQNVTINVEQNIHEGMSTNLQGRQTDNAVESEEDYYLSNDENFSCLLTHCENDYIQYRSKHYMRDQNADFMRDVVSFWNTPRYHRSYIILGVVERSHPPHDLIGLDHCVDDNYYQTLFNANFFSGMPHFQYTQKQIEGKRIGVIVVSNSDILRGDPICPTKCHQNGLWEVNDLLYRDRRSGIRVARSPEEIQRVLSWFHDSRKTESPLCAQIKSDIGEKFLESVDHFEDGRAYCLITGPCSIDTASVSVLSNIPWIKAFDIDPDSRESGLFSVCEEQLRNKRSLYISHCNDSPKELSDKAIEWCFVKTNYHTEESPISEREWRKVISVGIEQHCQKLADFTLRRKPVTVIVLWYSSENLLPCLKILLEKLDERVSALKIVFCFDKVSIKEKAYEMLRGNFEYLNVPQESIHDIPFEYICLKLCEELKDAGQVGRFKLPAMKGEAMMEIEIAPKDAAWLKEFFDVLYLDYDHNLATGGPEDFGQDFLRGGTLSWYEVKLHLFDVEREIFSKLKNLIHDNISKGRSAVVSLYHAPGSGGTTVGRRMLWDIHLERKCSCVYVNSKSPEFLVEVEQRISWLHDKTYLPVFVLIDSFVYKDSVGVSRLFNVCSREVPVVILYVQRYIGRITKYFQGNKAWLEGEVSYNEAIRLERVFSASCPPDAKQGLKELMLNVTQKSNPIIVCMSLD